jgi:hypothetical protein
MKPSSRICQHCFKARESVYEVCYPCYKRRQRGVTAALRYLNKHGIKVPNAEVIAARSGV